MIMSKMNMLAVVSAVQTIASSEKIDVGISLLQAVAPNVPAEKTMFAERFPYEILVERLFRWPGRLFRWCENGVSWRPEYLFDDNLWHNPQNGVYMRFISSDC